MNTKTGRKKPSNTPSMYKESKLFHPFGKKDIRKTETLPDPSLENIQPEEEEKEEALSNSKKATDILNSMLDKAARNTMPSEPQAKREYGHSFFCDFCIFISNYNISILNRYRIMWFRHSCIRR